MGSKRKSVQRARKKEKNQNKGETENGGTGKEKFGASSSSKISGCGLFFSFFFQIALIH